MVGQRVAIHIGLALLKRQSNDLVINQVLDGMLKCEVSVGSMTRALVEVSLLFYIVSPWYRMEMGLRSRGLRSPISLSF